MPEAMVYCAHDDMVAIDDVKPHPENPNVHPQDQVRKLANLIAAVGWRHPIVVSDFSGCIIAGHGRLAAAKMLGLDEVPVDYQPYKSRDEELTVLVSDNVIPELAEMDDDALAKLVKEIDAGEFSADDLGFSDKALDALLAELEEEVNPLVPEIKFSQELHECSNYIVLLFDNDVDWLQAMTLFDLQTVKSLDSRRHPQFERRGIGRVLKGAEAIEIMRGGSTEG